MGKKVSLDQFLFLFFYLNTQYRNQKFKHDPTTNLRNPNQLREMQPRSTQKNKNKITREKANTIF